MIVTAKGQSIRFKEKNVRPMGRSASGVRGVLLKDEDEVVGMDMISERVRAKKRTGTTAKAIVEEKGIEESEAQALLAETKEERKAKNSDILIVTENGYGKRSALGLYKVQGRGGSGIKTAHVSEKTGKIVSTKILERTSKGDLIIISKKGQMIRIPIKGASRLGRDTQGVRLMRLNAGDGVASVSYLPEIVIKEAK